MGSVYVDTSVWLAWLGREASCERIERAMQTAGELCTSNWTQLEIASGLGIKYRRGDINQNEMRQVMNTYHQLLQQSLFSEVLLKNEDIKQALQFCANPESGLRAGDALHLSIARRLRYPYFFSLDKILNRNAVAFGLQLIEI